MSVNEVGNLRRWLIFFKHAKVQVERGGSRELPIFIINLVTV
jgi:hypothetical protein